MRELRLLPHPTTNILSAADMPSAMNGAHTSVLSLSPSNGEILQDPIQARYHNLFPTADYRVLMFWFSREQ